MYSHVGETMEDRTNRRTRRVHAHIISIIEYGTSFLFNSLTS